MIKAIVRNTADQDDPILYGHIDEDENVFYQGGEWEFENGQLRYICPDNDKPYPLYSLEIIRIWYEK